MNLSLFLITFTQVVTESLPISSSSHLRLVGYLLTLSGVEMPAIAFSAHWESFEHLLHIPTVIVVGMVIGKLLRGSSVAGWVVPLSLPRVARTAGHDDGASFSNVTYWWSTIRSFFPLVIATAVTVACYYISKLAWLMQIMPFRFPTWMGLAITGGVLLATRWFSSPSLSPHRESRNLSHSLSRPWTSQGDRSDWNNESDWNDILPNWWQGALIGLAQGAALCPGLSRLGLTYGAGVFLGLGSVPALLFSFMLQLILMSGAIFRALLKLACQVSKYSAGRPVIPDSSSPLGEGVQSGTQLLSSSLFSLQTFVALVLGAFVAYQLLLLVVHLVRKNRLWPLSIYLFTLSLIWMILNLP